MQGDNISGAEGKLAQEIQKIMSPQDKKEIEEVAGLISWKVDSKGKDIKVEGMANLSQVDVTTVSTSQKRVKAPGEVMLLGYKIDLKDKLESFKESYGKNYAQTKSHNYLLSKFAMIKVAFLGQMLSSLGLTLEEIIDLQKKAIEGTIAENTALFKENEYNNELIEIVGGPKKQVRSQKKAIDEIRRQLTIQANNLGVGYLYTQRKILEVRLEQSNVILDNFREEKSNLEYQLEYMGQ